MTCNCFRRTAGASTLINKQAANTGVIHIWVKGPTGWQLAANQFTALARNKLSSVALFEHDQLNAEAVKRIIDAGGNL